MIFTYEHDDTIHKTKELDVEVDASGKVVAVWFRCIALPFQQYNVDGDRVIEIRKYYTNTKSKLIPDIRAVEVEFMD